jgi:hypothetical protein
LPMLWLHPVVEKVFDFQCAGRCLQVQKAVSVYDGLQLSH